MKIALLLTTMALMPLFANAHVHDDWVTVHRVDVRTHELIHTASTSSTNHLAVLTIDCNKSVTLYEARGYLTAASPYDVWYSIDAKPYTRINNEQLQHQASVTTFVGNVKAIDTLKSGNKLEYVVENRVQGVKYSYHFSLKGMSQAYEALGELCKW